MLDIILNALIIACDAWILYFLYKDLKRIAEIEAKVKNLQQRTWVMECKSSVREVMEDDGK